MTPCPKYNGRTERLFSNKMNFKSKNYSVLVNIIRRNQYVTVLFVQAR